MRLAKHFIAILQQFNNTGARTLDSMYHMMLKVLRNPDFCMKRKDFAIHIYSMSLWTSLRSVTKISKPLFGH